MTHRSKNVQDPTKRVTGFRVSWGSLPQFWEDRNPEICFWPLSIHKSQTNRRNRSVSHNFGCKNRDITDSRLCQESNPRVLVPFRRSGGDLVVSGFMKCAQIYDYKDPHKTNFCLNHAQGFPNQLCTTRGFASVCTLSVLHTAVCPRDHAEMGVSVWWSPKDPWPDTVSRKWDAWLSKKFVFVLRWGRAKGLLDHINNLKSTPRKNLDWRWKIKWIRLTKKEQKCI